MEKETLIQPPPLYHPIYEKWRKGGQCVLYANGFKK
jgi:hypothetical protein